MQKEHKESETISSEEIEKCISVLERLVEDTDQIFDIPKDKRTALIKVSGQFSRPSREEFARRKKDAKKNAKRKQAAISCSTPGIHWKLWKKLWSIIVFGSD